MPVNPLLRRTDLALRDEPSPSQLRRLRQMQRDIGDGAAGAGVPDGLSQTLKDHEQLDYWMED